MDESQPTSRDTVRVLAALSDENRFRIVQLLAAENEELSCGAIGKALDMSPSLLSHHLGILAEAEIIGRRKNGLWTMNGLRRRVIERQVEMLRALVGGNGRAEPVIRLHREQDDDGSAPADSADAAPSVQETTGPGDEAVAGS